jgi:epoxyqueuosine reductase
LLFSKDLLEQLQIGDWGYTEEVTPRSFAHYKDWVNKELSSPLTYLEDHRMKARESLISVMPDAQSALVFLFNYHPQKICIEGILKKLRTPFRMASYLFGFKGRDYHDEVKERLELLGDYLKRERPELNYRSCLDIHPVLERDLAYRSGLGWFGKNSMLISRRIGSFTIVGSLVLNQRLESEEQRTVDTDHCGQCRACVEACPTDAILEEERQIIASRCISTFTIEMFKESKEAPLGMNKADGEIFGCDICQDVCPWNSRADRSGVTPVDEDKFKIDNKLILESFLIKPPSEVIANLEHLSNGAYKRKFIGTPLERTGRVGMLKNLKFWSR